MGCADRVVRLRRDRVFERGRTGRPDPPAGPSLRRAEAHRDGPRAGRLRIRRHGAGQDRPRAGGFHDAARDRPGTAQPVRLGVTLADHAHEPAGGRFRHAHLGTNACADDQLLGFECLARQGLIGRALLGSVRHRRARHRRGEPLGHTLRPRET